MNPEGTNKATETSDNNEERQKPSRDTVNDNENNECENIVAPQKANGAGITKEEITGKPPVPMERRNIAKRADGASGKFSETSKNIVRPTRKERTIPDKDNLAVRYVKMRTHKSEDLPSESEEVKESERTKEVPEISEKVLEGILGVKAERKEGERWVKLSEVDPDDAKQDAKGGKTDNDGRDIEGREEKLLKSALNLEVEGKEEERSAKLREVDVDNANRIGKGGNTKEDEKSKRREAESPVKLSLVDVDDPKQIGKGEKAQNDEEEMEGREDKLSKNILGGEVEGQEGDKPVKSEEVDVDDAKQMEKAGKTKDDEREMDNKENKPFKTILGFKSERKEGERSVKFSEVDIDDAKQVGKGGKTKDYKSEMEEKEGKPFKTILGFKSERKEGERSVKFSEVDIADAKQVGKGGKTKDYEREMAGKEDKPFKTILGFKSERKEGERSVKLSEVDIDDAKQAGKGGKTKDSEREVGEKEDKPFKTILGFKSESKEGERSVKFSEVDIDDAKQVGKGGKTKDYKSEMEEKEDKPFKTILGFKSERKEGEKLVKLSEVDIDDAKQVGKGGKTKDYEREVESKEDKPFKTILGFKTERKEGERSVKFNEVDIDDAKQVGKGGKTKYYEKEVEGRDDKLFKNILSFLAERKERENLREVEGKDEEDIDREKKPKNEGEVEESKENGGRKKVANREEKSTTRKFSAGKMGARLVSTRNSVRMDCITLAKGIRARRKERNASLKYSFERRIETAERILEDRVGNFLEETAEKHPWLQPIETWIVDRYKSARSAKPRESVSRSLSSESEPEKITEIVIKEEKEDEAGETDSGEIFIESVKKNEGANSCKDSHAESSPELSKSRGKGNASKEDQTAATGKIEKVERSHHVDLLDKLRDGFKEKVEDVQRYFQRTSRLADVNRKLKSQIWSSVVTIVLVEAKNLLPMDIDGLSDPYVKFRLGTEKYKSKVVNKTLSPVWLEQFDLHLYEDPYLGQELEVTVWDRDKSHQDDLMGRTVIDLASMERETTHRLWRDLEDGAGNIYLLLTISGTTASETISDLAAHEETPQERSRLLQKYSLRNSLQRPRDVGHLTVKVYRAQGLAAADLGGKSDPFCVLELVNARLQTQTEYKTLAPNWQKIFTFNVKDINSVLEVTVYDEDRDHKVEFLGRVAIPLLRIRNAEKRWYALKDKKLRGRAKGNSPQIMLEMIVVWNVLRACARTLNPKEKKYMEPEVKFKRQVFLRNVLRLKAIIVFFIDMGKYIQSCWEWESKTRSIVALVLFVLLCYYFEPWMIPTAALLILMKYCMVAMLTGGSFTTSYQHSPSVGQLHDSGDGASDEGPATPGDDDDDEDDKDKEEKKSLKERLQAIQEVTQTVQNSIGYIASLCERIKNLFNFTVPYLSYLAMVLTILGVIVLYFIPMRYLILAWGVNKFLRKLLRPHSVPNNEVLDLISRVPDDEDLLSYRELKPVPTADCERGGTSSTSTGATAATRRDLRKKHKAA